MVRFRSIFTTTGICHATTRLSSLVRTLDGSFLPECEPPSMSINRTDSEDRSAEHSLVGTILRSGAQFVGPWGWAREASCAVIRISSPRFVFLVFCAFVVSLICS